MEIDINKDKLNIDFNKTTKSFEMIWKEKKWSIIQYRFNFYATNIIRASKELEFIKNKNSIIELVHYSFSDMDISIIYNNENIDIITNKKNKTCITISELNNLCNMIYSLYDNVYRIVYDIRKFDSPYLALFLWKRLEYIECVEIENVYIDSLVVPKGKEDTRHLEETIFYKCLLEGKEFDIPTVFPSNHIHENSYDRLIKSLKSIKQNGYPYNNKYIILYNNEMIIRDGQHRACCLKYLYGNISIPVMRIHLNNNEK